MAALPKRAAVIGAGAAGLVTAQRLLSAGLRVTVFERSGSVGGLWRYDAGDTPGSVMYASLRTNLPKEVMLLRGARVPPAAWSFLSHRQVLEHLASFAAAHGLDVPQDAGGVTRFHTSVRAVTPTVPGPPLLPPFLAPGEAADPAVQAQVDSALRAAPADAAAAAAALAAVPPGAESAQWQLAWEAPDGSGSETFDFVAVCNGHYGQPAAPALPGLEAFAGQVLHSAAYRTPEAFAGKTVMVLGSGPSGQDIGREVAAVASRVYMATHSCSEEREGAALASDRRVVATAAPVAVAADGAALRTAHGAVVPVDVLLWCTGYDYSFPFLSVAPPSAAPPGTLLASAHRRVHPLYKATFHALYPTLAFVGLPQQINPNPAHAAQADALAAVWSGSGSLPPAPDRLADTYAEYELQTVRLGKALRHASKLGAGQWRFWRGLLRGVGLGAEVDAAASLPLAALEEGAEGALDAAMAAAPVPSATYAIPHSVLTEAGILEAPEERLLPPALAGAGAAPDAFTTTFPASCAAGSAAKKPRHGRGGNAALAAAYDWVQGELSPIAKLLLDNAMYVHCGASRAPAPQTYRLQEYRFGGLLQQLGGCDVRPLAELQLPPATAIALAAHGATAALPLAGASDFYWVLAQFPGWYVGAPLGSQGDPLAGQVTVDPLA